MDHSTPNGFALIGPGRAGTAVSVALVRAGRRCVGVAGRDRNAPSTRHVAARLDVPPTTLPAAVAPPDLIAGATPDPTPNAAAASPPPTRPPRPPGLHR